MKILNEKQIDQKIRRLAYEIIEHNFEEKEIILAGINNNGMHFASLLLKELSQISEMPIRLTGIRLNPASPNSSDVVVEDELKTLDRKVIIVVDDVANTGRTIFFAIKPLLKILPKKIEVAVLVDRKHKSFPIAVDYVGLSLATTLHENIDVQIREVKEMAVYLN